VFTNVVGLLDPFQFTTELEINPDPLTVRVKAWLPAVALEGDNELTAGVGLEVVPPPKFPPLLPPPQPTAVSASAVASASIAADTAGFGFRRIFFKRISN
jgi:hypothetical protein